MNLKLPPKQVNLRGQGLIEYALILVLVFLVSLAGLRLLGVDTKSLYEKFTGMFDAQEKIYLTDSFLDLKAWKVIYGQTCLKAENGILSTTKASCESRIMNTGTLPKDYTVSMDMAELLNGNGFGLMFRLDKNQGNYSGYSFQVDPGLGNKFAFRRYDANGVELSTPLAVAAFPVGFNKNEPHAVSVTVKGNTFTGYIDGVAVLTATDNTYQSGGAGLRVWDSTQANFSGFSVSEAP